MPTLERIIDDKKITQSEFNFLRAKINRAIFISKNSIEKYKLKVEFDIKIIKLLKRTVFNSSGKSIFDLIDNLRSIYQEILGIHWMKQVVVSPSGIQKTIEPPYETNRKN